MICLSEPMSNNIKILITGSSGFVASNLYQDLHDDFDLSGLDITKESLFPPERVFDWENLENLPEVDTIIHLAGKAHDTSNTARTANYFEINLGLTQRIFEHFLISNAKTFIFFSSVKAVADTIENSILEENVIPNPKTAYGKSKLAAEQYISSQTLPENKKVYILRPCMIHGPGNKGNLNLLYKIVKKGIPWPLGSFTNERSFVSIGNLIFVLRQLIEKEIPSGIYNIADDESLSTNEIINLIAESLHRETRILNIPTGIVRFSSKIGDLLHLPLNSERLKKLTESYVVSNTKLKSVLKINSLPITAKSGLRLTLKHF
jgi:nucleoside-diphosphate-sugar epimerase